jgi:hypothetical protein
MAQNNAGNPPLGFLAAAQKAGAGIVANLPTVLGAIGTILGVIATTWASINTSRIDTLKFQYQTDTAFAAAIETDEAKLAAHDADGNHAAVAFVSLYAQAETVLQKLELIELAQTAKQFTAMLALSGIGGGDSSVQLPKNADTLPAAAIKLAIRTSGSATISASETPPPILSTTTTTGGPAAQTQQLPASDPPATQSANIEVRSNAALIAALPAGTVSGWAFIGDASGPNLNDKDAVLDPGTDTISSPRVPAAKTIVMVCQDLNIRIQPFQNGALGQIVGIATRGSTLKVDENPPLSADGTSAYDKKKQIAAKWIHVTLLQGAAAATASPTKC